MCLNTFVLKIVRYNFLKFWLLLMDWCFFLGGGGGKCSEQLCSGYKPCSFTKSQMRESACFSWRPWHVPNNVDICAKRNWIWGIKPLLFCLWLPSLLSYTSFSCLIKVSMKQMPQEDKRLHYNWPLGNFISPSLLFPSVVTMQLVIKRDKGNLFLLVTKAKRVSGFQWN